MVTFANYKTFPVLKNWARDLDQPNFAKDTTLGLQLQAGRHYRTYLAGYKQEYMRSILGIIIDNETSDCIVLKGMTIHALKALRAQFEQEKASEAEVVRQNSLKEFHDLLVEVNQIESQFLDLGLERTDVESFTCLDDDHTPYTSKEDLDYAIHTLKNRLTTLKLIKIADNAIRQIIVQLPQQQIEFYKDGLMSNAGWTISYNADRLKVFAADLALAQDTEVKVEALYRVFETQLLDLGFILENDESGTIICAREESVYQEELPFDSIDLWFKFQNNSGPVQQLQWHSKLYDFTSIDALLVVQQLTNMSASGLTLRDPEAEPKTLGESLGYRW